MVTWKKQMVKMGEEEEILKNCINLVSKVYEDILDDEFDLENKLGDITINVKEDLEWLAYSNNNGQIFLKSIREDEDENVLLVIHEILHILFTNSMIHLLSIKLADEKRVQIECGFLQGLLDMFVDFQIKMFTSFDQVIWSNLNKPEGGNYFSDEVMEYIADEFIKEKEIDKKLVNLEAQLKEFLDENIELILDRHSISLPIPRN